MQTGELGLWLAIVYGTGTFVGTVLGGTLASRYAPGNERLQLRAMTALYVGYALITPFVYLSPGAGVAFALLGLSMVGINMAIGPLFATIQTLVQERMRAMSIALLFLFANLIGLGLGPLFVGALSDVLTPWAHQESLRYALLTLCPGYLWCAFYFWKAGSTVMRDLERAQVLHDRVSQDGTETSSRAPGIRRDIIKTSP